MLPNKIPPQNLEAERAVLGAILLDPKVFFDIGLIEKDFYKTAHQLIFGAMKTLKDKGINLIAITEQLQIKGQLEQVGGVSYVTALANEAITTVQIKQHAKIVRDKSIRRGIAIAALRVYSEVEDAALDDLSKTMRRAFEINPDAQMLGTKHIKEVVPGVLDYIERRYKHKVEISGVPSGFRQLDVMTDGFQSELYVLGGRSSHGKSALVKDFAMNAARADYKVHFINIEDGNENTIRRLFAREANIPLWKLRKGHLSPDELKSIFQAAGALAELQITFDDTISRLEPILNSIRRAVDDGAQEIFIDYLQLIRGDKSMKRYQEIGDIVQEIKEICKPANLNIPIILTCQLLRQVDKGKARKPVIADLRESGNIEIDADVVFLLHRPGAYKCGSGKEHEDVELIVAKGRNIGIGSVPLTFIPNMTTFYDRESATSLIK